MIYFSSDHHFGHKNILAHCNRDYKTIHDMNEDLIERWNKTVTNNDIVYYLGDFSLGPKLWMMDILKRLNRKKIILIWGNHDRSHNAMREIGFDEVHSYMELKHEKKKIFMSHVPISSMYHDVCLCGHIHNVFRINGNIFNVGVDVNDFRPVSFNEIPWNELDRSKFKPVDQIILGQKGGGQQV